MTTPVGEQSPQEWSRGRPEHLPRPTVWPAVMAFGITFLLWGLITSPVVCGAGALSLIASLAGWIGELRHEPQ